LPLDIYIDCWVDGDLYKLIISGNATQEELQKVWDKIFLQSLQLSQSGTYNEAFEIMKEIDECNAKLTIVNNTVRHLSMAGEQDIDNDMELVAVLSSMALRPNIKPEDRGQVLIQKLNAVIARAKKWVDKVISLRETLKEIRNDKDGKIDRNYFDNWLDCISEYKGYHIKATDITVSRFYNAIAQIKERNQKREIEKAKYA
jgi:hypothetical protein